jgi:hypothetical protein
MDLKVSLPTSRRSGTCSTGRKSGDGSIVNEAGAPHEMEKPDVLDARTRPPTRPGCRSEGVDRIGPRGPTVSVREAGDDDDDDEPNTSTPPTRSWGRTDAVKARSPGDPRPDLDGRRRRRRGSPLTLRVRRSLAS